MKSFFEPKSIAVAGVSADPNKLGSIIFANLVANLRKGLLRSQVYALNPSRDQVGDQPCYPSIGSLPETPELLIVAVPESATLELVRTAAEAGVKAAVIVTSGYAEAGRGDVEKEIQKVAARHGMRILGPNTIGLLDTRSGVNLLFLRPTKTLPDGSQVVSRLEPLVGGVTIVTQSGYLGEVISEELASIGVGIRALVGTGNQVDVSVEDVIRYFADDPYTKVMVVYLEGARDGREFVRSVAFASGKKPVVILKVGKTVVGARAALTHTASLVGSYEAYRAAFRQAGAIEAESVQELTDYAVSLSMLPRVTGKRLVIIANAGGIGAIAADEAERLGLRVGQLGMEVQRRLRSEFKDAGFISNAALGNPIDLTASATTDEFVRVSESVLALKDYDLVLEMPTHQTPAIDYDIAARLGEVVSKSRKAVCICVIGNSDLAGRIRREFMARGIPSFPTPERAVRALGAVTRYAEKKVAARRLAVHRRRAPLRFSRAVGPLPPREVSRLLRGYGIGEPKSVIVHSSAELRGLDRFQFPVACKLMSEGLLHKTDVGGVVVNVARMAEAESVLARLKKLAERKGLRFDGMLVQEMVEDGVELILGGTRDLTFGPLVVLGVGGMYAELISDYVLALAPVTPREVRVVLAQTKLSRILEGYRGGPKANVGRLCRVVSDFSNIMVDNPRIDQMEVNPLMAKADRVLSVDARVILGSGRVESLNIRNPGRR